MDDNLIRIEMYNIGSIIESTSLCVLSNDIPLYKACECTNWGFYLGNIAKKDCNVCHGTGLALTDNGKALKLFIERLKNDL